jgi:hypothetical protein
LLQCANGSKIFVIDIAFVQFATIVSRLKGNQKVSPSPSSVSLVKLTSMS